MTHFKCVFCEKVDELDKAINDPRYGLVCENCHKEVDDRPVKFPPSENTCVCCGEVIPEGRQVCAICEPKLEKLADEYDKLGESYIVSPEELKDALAFNKKKDSPVDIHKIIDDAMEKRDRTVSIFISAENNAVSVNVYPVDHDKCQWIYQEDSEYRYNFECSNCGITSEFNTAYCPSCSELMHGVRRVES